jgi:superfamily II DNA or RNA helicase
VFLIPLTLQNILEIRDARERVSLSQQNFFEDGQHLVDEETCEAFEMNLSESGIFNLELYFKDGANTCVSETVRESHLNFSCSKCTSVGRSVSGCQHQWAAYLMLFEALHSDTFEIKNDLILKLSKKLKASNKTKALPKDKFSKYENVALDSISIMLDEQPLFKGSSLSSLLDLNFSKYQKMEVTPEEQHLAPNLLRLPEVFRKKVTAFSDRYFNETAQQNAMADILRYNFSNGMQFSSQNILCHPLYKNVSPELLPRPVTGKPLFSKWPLLADIEGGFVSTGTQELQDIIQHLLAEVSSAASRHKIELFLQSKNRPSYALKVQNLEFMPKNEIDWRVDFIEKPDLQAEFKLVSFRNRPLYFFNSFALEPNEGAVIAYSFKREFKLLQEKLSKISEDIIIPLNEAPKIEAPSELVAKQILKYLRTRPIPVKLTAGSHTIVKDKSCTEIRLNENGEFYLHHEARVSGQKNLERRGWSSTSEVYLQAMSQGLQLILNMSPKDIASQQLQKRSWDIKLLKHLGILQYIFLEALSLHFDGTLTDGLQIEKSDLFKALEERIQSLLIAGSGSNLVKDTPLKDLCSKSVLACLQDFINSIFNSVSANESFYSEEGEVVLEGLVEREFRLIYEILKTAALNSSGDVFGKSRTALLDRISASDSDLYHFPASNVKNRAGLHQTLTSLQFLIPFGFQIFYKDQPLTELKEDEFHVDFVVLSDGEPKNYNWFELNPKFFLLGQEVDSSHLLGLGSGGVIEYEGKLYLVPKKQMPSLRRLENFWHKLQNGKNEHIRKKGAGVYQLPRSQTLELLALRASGVGIRGDFEWKKLCEFYDNLGKSNRELKLPKSNKANLKPYQISGIQWLQDLYNLRLGALLADDMGLGKTLQTLSFLDDLRSRDEMGPVLLVVPSSLIFNWQDEIQKFTPELKLQIFSVQEIEKISKLLAQKIQMVVITTYGMLAEHEAYFSQYKFNIVIFDEAQNLKNLSTKRTSSARALNGNFKICLTGTPMENHYGEFYSLIDLLVPGSLGELADFRKNFVNTELIPREKMDDLKLKVKPLLLRRTKKEIMDQLPEKLETKVSIAFEDRQKEIYRDIALSYNERVKETMALQGVASVQLQMLTAILRLRQACSDPAALPNIKYDKIPPKIETLLESIKELVESGESALVFTQFIQTLEHTAKILQENNIPVFVLHGKVPTKQRRLILSEFSQLATGAVLIMTLKTGGVGLNLTKASYVFHLEPWWNPSVENQATDRAHRLGQNKAVQVFKYIMHDSLEEKIELLKNRKDIKFKSLFATTEQDSEIDTASTALSKEDFDLLLGIK